MIGSGPRIPNATMIGWARPSFILVEFFFFSKSYNPYRFKPIIFSKMSYSVTLVLVKCYIYNLLGYIKMNEKQG